MSKETFYFSHDYNARTDDKIKRLVRTHGMLGYGIFWAIVEDLYNNANALQLDCDGIAYDLHTDYKVVKSVINDFDLFTIEDDKFGSFSIERRITERDSKSEKARESAFKRWNKKKDNANALPTQSDSNAIEYSIVNKKKESILEIEIPDCLNTVEFSEKWKTLLSQKKWKKKSIDQIIQTLENLSKYDVVFSVELVKNAISNDTIGITYSNTDQNYQKWIKQNDFDNMTPEQKDGYRQKIISDFYSDEKWINSTALYLGVDLITFKRRLLSFLEKLKATDGIYKPAKDIKEHFVNWHNKQTEKQSA